MLEPRVGVEPTTCRLRIGCSTTELPRLIKHLRVASRTADRYLRFRCVSETFAIASCSCSELTML